MNWDGYTHHRTGLYRGIVAAIAAVVAVVLGAGIAGFGNFAASVPGVVILLACGYLGFRAGRGLGQAS